MNYNLKKEMLSKLKKKYFKELFIAVLVYLILIMFLIGIIIFIFINVGEFVARSIVVVVGIAIIVPIFTKALLDIIPYLREYKNVKKNNFRTIIGKVIFKRKVENLGGDFTNYTYYPIIENEELQNKEIELEADGTELGKKYYCIYYPNTKFAICEEIINDEIVFLEENVI